MYKYIDNQIKFEDFETPTGMTLHKENRWVIRAESIPWEKIEPRYAALFKNKKGNVAKPLRLALGACIIQAEYGFSDEETATMIQEHPYLQFFCGYKKYNDTKLPFDPSVMVHFRKRLTAEILGEINELVIQKALKNKPSDNQNDDENNQDNSNNGTMIVDATCAPSQIKFPQDTELLNEAREFTEKIIDELHNSKDGVKPRTYRKVARKAYLNIARSKKRTAKKIRKAIRQQLGFVNRNIHSIDKMLSCGKDISEKKLQKLSTVKMLFQQQKFMYDNRTHSVSNRIISLSQPWLRPIVRGKAKANVEFGAKLDISVVDGWTRLEYHSFEAYNEATNLPEMIERYKNRTGRYPERILADKIYRNRANLGYCSVRGIRLSGPALGRPKKDEIRNKKQDYIDEAERIEVERKFSLAKRKCGLGLIVTRLRETTCHRLALSILLLNIRKIAKLIRVVLYDWVYLVVDLLHFQKLGFVQ